MTRSKVPAPRTRSLVSAVAPSRLTFSLLGIGQTSVNGVAVPHGSHLERDWLKQRRLPKGSVTSMILAPHGTSEMPGFMFALGREDSSAWSASTSSM